MNLVHATIFPVPHSAPVLLDPCSQTCQPNFYIRPSPLLSPPTEPYWLAPSQPLDLVSRVILSKRSSLL